MNKPSRINDFTLCLLNLYYYPDHGTAPRPALLPTVIGAVKQLIEPGAAVLLPA